MLTHCPDEPSPAFDPPSPPFDISTALPPQATSTPRTARTETKGARRGRRIPNLPDTRPVPARLGEKRRHSRGRDHTVAQVAWRNRGRAVAARGLVDVDAPT